MRISAVFTPVLKSCYVGFNPGTGTGMQGEAVEEALVNLSEVTQLCL